MARLNVEEKFDEFKVAFKQKWHKVGDDELDSMLDIKENEEGTIEKLAEKYGKTKDEMKKDFHEWINEIEAEKEDDVEEILEDIEDIDNIDKFEK